MSITLLDSTAIVGIRFGDTEVRQPDFIDPVFDTAIWMSEEGCVEVPVDMLADVPRLARGCYAPVGLGKPRTLGIRVDVPPTWAAPAFKGWARERELSLWVAFGTIVGAHTVDA